MPGMLTAAALESKAVEHAERDDFEAASDLLAAAVRLHPTGVRHELLAQCLMQLGRDDAALAEIKHSNDLEPNWAVGYLTRARLEVNTGALRDALHSYKAFEDLGGEEDVSQEIADALQLLDQQIARRLGLPEVSIAQDLGGQAGPGCVIWESGLALAEYLTRHVPRDELRDARVLELGSGTGISGIAAALLGAHVMLTDNPDVFPLLSANIASNQAAITRAHGCAQAVVYDWESLSLPRELLGGGFNILLGADLVYSERGIPALSRAVEIARVSNPGIRVFLAHKSRSDAVDRALFQGLEQLGFCFQQVGGSDVEAAVKVYFSPGGERRVVREQ